MLLERHNRLGEQLAAPLLICDEMTRANIDLSCLFPCSLEQVVLERYNRLGEQVAACYSGASLRPSPGELQQLFRSVTPPWQ